MYPKNKLRKKLILNLGWILGILLLFQGCRSESPSDSMPKEVSVHQEEMDQEIALANDSLELGNSIVGSEGSEGSESEGQKTVEEQGSSSGIGTENVSLDSDIGSPAKVSQNTKPIGNLSSISSETNPNDGVLTSNDSKNSDAPGNLISPMEVEAPESDMPLQQVQNSASSPLQYVSDTILIASEVESEDSSPPQTVSISGTILEDQTEFAIGRVIIRWQDQWTMSDEDGRFQLEIDNNGREWLSFNRYGYETKKIKIDLSSEAALSLNVRLASDLSKTNHNVGGVTSLNGLVKEINTLRPLTRVTIRVGNRVAFTDSQGFYSLDWVPTGEILVVVRKYGYRSFTQLVDKTTGTEQYLNVYLIPDLRLTDYPVGSISSVSGQVLDSVTQLPLERVTIRIGKNVMLSNRDGYYTIENILEGNNVLRALKFGYFPYESMIFKESDIPYTHHIELLYDPSYTPVGDDSSFQARTRGKVFKSLPNSVTNIRLRNPADNQLVTNQQGEPLTVEVDENGNFVLDVQLPDGLSNKNLILVSEERSLDTGEVVEMSTAMKFAPPNTNNPLIDAITTISPATSLFAAKIRRNPNSSLVRARQKTAEQLGVSENDLVSDPNSNTNSSQANAALVALSSAVQTVNNSPNPNNTEQISLSDIMERLGESNEPIIVPKDSPLAKDLPAASGNVRIRTKEVFDILEPELNDESKNKTESVLQASGPIVSSIAQQSANEVNQSDEGAKNKAMVAQASATQNLELIATTVRDLGDPTAVNSNDPDALPLCRFSSSPEVLSIVTTSLSDFSEEQMNDLLKEDSENYHEMSESELEAMTQNRTISQDQIDELLAMICDLLQQSQSIVSQDLENDNNEFRWESLKASLIDQVLAGEGGFLSPIAKANLLNQMLSAGLDDLFISELNSSLASTDESQKQLLLKATAESVGKNASDLADTVETLNKTEELTEDINSGNGNLQENNKKLLQAAAETTRDALNNTENEELLSNPAAVDSIVEENKVVEALTEQEISLDEQINEDTLEEVVENNIALMQEAEEVAAVNIVEENAILLIAQAGDDQTLVQGESTTLAGTSNVSDNDGLSFQWTIENQPITSTLVLEDSNQSSIVVAPNEIGLYVFTLTVQLEEQSSSDSIELEVLSGETAQVLVSRPISSLGGDVSEDQTTATMTVSLSKPPLQEVATFWTVDQVSEAIIQPSQLVFNSLNWDAPQTLTVIGVDDFRDDGDQNILILGTVSSSDLEFSQVAIEGIALTNLDNDQAQIFRTTTRGVLSETSSAAEFDLSMTTSPDAPVSIEILSSRENQVIFSPNPVVFNSDNWQVTQTVNISAIDDDLSEGTQDLTIEFSIQSIDETYADLEINEFSIPILDNDTPGVFVSEASNNISEQGASATFEVLLLTKPNSNVVIDLLPSDNTEAVLSTTQLTFTSDNWNAAQIITVSGVDDEIQDGSQTVTIQLLPIQTGDESYIGIKPKDVTLLNLDNDSAGFFVQVNQSEALESGEQAEFQIHLLTKPSSEVRLGFTSSNSQELVMEPDFLIYTSENWNAPQLVKGLAVEDVIQEGNQTVSILWEPAVSNDVNYHLKTPNQALTLTVVDNDVSGYEFQTSSLETSENGGQVTVSVRLNSQPNSSVTLNMKSSDLGEMFLNRSSLTFTPENWNSFQTFEVTGVSDNVVDGNQTVPIQFPQVDSEDDYYSGLIPSPLVLTNLDTNTAGIQTSVVSSPLNESGTEATFVVALTSQPLGEVQLNWGSTDETELIIENPTVVFDSENWNEPQFVFLNGVDDNLVDGNQTVFIQLLSVLTDDPNFQNIQTDALEATNVDDDSPGIGVSDVLDLLREPGTTATFTIQLFTEPHASVDVFFASSAPDEITVSPSTITFDSSNWNVAKTIELTSYDDDISDGHQIVNIEVASSSDDTHYNELSAFSFAVANLDNDCRTVQSGDLTNPQAVFGADYCTLESNYTISSGHTLNWDGRIGVLTGTLKIEEGATLNILGSTLFVSDVELGGTINFLADSQFDTELTIVNDGLLNIGSGITLSMNTDEWTLGTESASTLTVNGDGRFLVQSNLLVLGTWEIGNQLSAEVLGNVAIADGGSILDHELGSVLSLWGSLSTQGANAFQWESDSSEIYLYSSLNTPSFRSTTNNSWSLSESTTLKGNIYFDVSNWTLTGAALDIDGKCEVNQDQTWDLQSVLSCGNGSNSALVLNESLSLIGTENLALQGNLQVAQSAGLNLDSELTVDGKVIVDSGQTLAIETGDLVVSNGAELEGSIEIATNASLEFSTIIGINDIDGKVSGNGDLSGVDQDAPSLELVSGISSPTNQSVLSITVQTNESGTLGYFGSCSGTVSQLAVGTTDISFNSLSEGTYNDCSLVLTDALGNISNALNLDSFTIDQTAPTLNLIQAVHTPTPDATPSFIVSASEVGTFQLSGSCTTSDSSIVSGENTITLNTLTIGEYSGCSFKMTDLAGNETSASISLPDFKIVNSTGLLAFYSFSGNAQDDSGNSMDGQVEGATLTSDRNANSNEAYAFDGVDDYISLASGFEDFTNGFTFASWVRFSDTTKTAQRLIHLASDSNVESVYVGQLANTNKFVAESFANNSSSGSLTPPQTTNGEIQQDTWQHIAVTNDNGGFQFYVNGAMVSTTGSSNAGTSILRTQNFLGKSGFSNEDFFSGAMDEVFIFNRVLSSNEIHQLTGIEDNDSPVLAEVVAIGTVTADSTPSYTFSANETGTLTFGGSCSSTTDSITETGNITLEFSQLSDGTYSDCTLSLTDSAGNSSNLLSITGFTVDTTAPTINLTSGIHSPSPDTTPSFELNSNEAGTISFSGSCTSSNLNITSGDNTVTLNTLALGTHTGCGFQVIDTVGNTSSSVSLGSFTIVDSSGLLAFYPFSGNANDASENSMDGTVVGAQLTSDKNSSANSAYVFDGVDDYIDLPDGFSDFTNGFSFVLWAKVNETSGRNFQRFVNLSASNNQELVYFGQYSTSNQLAADAYVANSNVGSVDVPRTDNSVISIGTWQHFAITNNAGTYTYFIDGVSVASSGSGPVGTNITRTDNFLGLSGFSNLDDYFKGEMDELYIYNRALTAQEILTLSEITDNTPPTLSEVTAVGTTINSQTPSYTFSTTEIGTLEYAGACSSDTTNVASVGNQTIVFNSLNEGTYNDCTITLTDPAGNQSTALSVNSFTIDTTAPTLAEVTAVSTPTNNTAPGYVFSADETGSISYGGSCSSSTTSVSSTGNQSITFNALNAGTYTDCTVTVTDSAGNASTALSVSSFTIDTTAPTLTEVTVVATPTNSTTPSYVFSTDETGSILMGDLVVLPQHPSVRQGINPLLLMH